MGSWTIVDSSDRIGDGDIRSTCENEKPLGHIIEMEKWLTACLSSRTLAQYSTDRYAGGLYCRVRNGTGCDPAALAVIPKHGISTNYLILSIFEILPRPSLQRNDNLADAILIHGWTEGLRQDGGCLHRDLRQPVEHPDN